MCNGHARQQISQVSQNPKHEAPDPTYRIGDLPSATRKLISVTPDSRVETAVTRMLANDFSQLPVMNGDRSVKGMVSWWSIGSRLALGKKCELVRECMDVHKVISADMPLLDSIGEIVENQYVLIQNSRGQITGIVTTSDLSIQFQQLGEPFLLIGEIENYIRRMLNDKFSKDELAEARDPADSEREINSVSDLTFGEYKRLLEEPSRWDKLHLAIDRKEFIGLLEEVRKIRNHVMHFDPKGTPDNDLCALRKVVRFFQTLDAMRQSNATTM